jgi:hypothetical protein
MARSITTKPATVKSKVQDPYTQPCFSIFSNDQTVYGGGWFLFDHNLEPIAKYSGDGDYHYNQFRTYSSYAPEFWNSYSGDEYMLTTSHVSSNTNRGGNTCNVGYLGHIGYPSVSEYTKTAGYVRGWPGVNRAAYGFRDVNSIVGDINQDWAWFTNNDSGDAYHRMYFGPRNTIKYYNCKEMSGSNFINVPIVTDSGPNTSTTTDRGMFGSSCYNAKAKKLVLMQTNNDGYKQPIVYNNFGYDLRALSLSGSFYSGTDDANAPKSNSDAPIYQKLASSEATPYDTGNARAYGSYSSEAEARYRCQTCITDDGQVYAFTMTPGNGAVMEHWQSNGAYDGVIWNPTYTTSYGYEQGVKFGSRWQVSSDGEYWWSYCPMYYYGSGIAFVVVRISDGKWLKFMSQDSSYGRTLAPLGKNKMVFIRDQNNDNPGAYYKVVDFDYEFMRRNNGDEISDWNSNRSAYLLDNVGNSTGYPFLIPSMYNTSLFTSQLESNQN